MQINRLAEEAQKGVQSSGCKPIIFNTITVSDGISMGTSGMRYSLVSREVIADSVETVAGAQGFDGLIKSEAVIKICRAVLWLWQDSTFEPSTISFTEKYFLCVRQNRYCLNVLNL